MALTTIPDDGLKTPVSDLQDNEMVMLGAGDDFQLYHNGTDNYLRSENGTILLTKSNNETLAQFIPDGAVKLYHNNVKQLETTASGVTITGNSVATSKFRGNDNIKVSLGDAEDLLIYHDGSNTYLQNTVGDLKIKGDTIRLRGQTADEMMISTDVNGTVGLAYDGVQKFETTSTGAKWDGWLYCDDSDQIRFGNGGDLQIYHDGSNSYLKEAGTGNLKVQANSSIITASEKVQFESANESEVLAVFYENDRCELYYDNVKKFETTSNGANVIGKLDVSGDFKLNSATNAGQDVDWDESTGSLTCQDNVKLYFGAAGDLEIYHDGSHSVIKESGTGDLRILTASFRLRNENAAEMMISADADGAVYLAYDGSQKFETNANGCLLGDSTKLQLGGNADLQIYHDGSNSNLINTTGNLIIKDTTDAIYLQAPSIRFQDDTTNEDIAKFISDGAIELYYDNSKKFETTTGGIKIYDHARFIDSGKALFGTGDDLEIYHDGTHSYIDNTGTGNLYLRETGTVKVRAARFGVDNHGGTETMMQMDENDAVELFYDNSKKFETHSSGVLISGNAIATSKFRGNDDIKLSLGDGEDLTIYHDGTNSLIKNGTGILSLQGDDIRLLNNAASEAILKGFADGSVEIFYDGVKKIETYNTGTKFNGDIRPTTDDTYDCGVSAAKWDDVYATNGTIQTSDRNQKNTIVTSDLGLPFINKLKPVSYKFNGKTRTHYGLISQDVETILSDISKPTSDFAGFIKEDDLYGLRYNEFIAPLIKAVQELSAEVETLKTKVAALEGG